MDVKADVDSGWERAMGFAGSRGVLNRGPQKRLTVAIRIHQMQAPHLGCSGGRHTPSAAGGLLEDVATAHQASWVQAYAEMTDHLDVPGMRIVVCGCLE